MKQGDLVRNKNSESGELGLFLGMRTFKRSKKYMDKYLHAEDYVCAQVYWPERGCIGTIQTNLLEVFDETDAHVKPAAMWYNTKVNR